MRNFTPPHAKFIALTELPLDLQADIAAIEKIAIVPSILDVVCRTTGMGFACIARVTNEKWIACSVKDDVAFGLQPGGELQLNTTICHEIQQHRQAVVINNVSEDPLYCRHHTPAMYGLQSYISVPIILKDGSFFGTLCAIDPNPHILDTPQVRGMFDCFVDLIAVHLDNIRAKEIAEDSLAEEKETAKLREMFIAILAHDLRNPVTAIKNSAELLTALKEYNPELLKVIENSVGRVNGLIQTMLDMARGRLAGGITKAKNLDVDLTEHLELVIKELQAVSATRKLQAGLHISRPVQADNARIAQLFSNLLGNAIKYGTPGTPVIVNAVTSEDEFILRVGNKGKKIPAETQQMLFKPFTRGKDDEDKPGLGLGLYIADEIARAHGGTIQVESSDEDTAFIFRMPL